LAGRISKFGRKQTNKQTKNEEDEEEKENKIQNPIFLWNALL